MRAFILICEGKSEVAYVQELNRFFREEDIDIYFAPRDACGGRPGNINRIIDSLSRRERTRAWVLLDEDIYQRGEARRELLKKPAKCLFNRWCLEDFLALHYPDAVLKRWIRRCKDAGHCRKPLPGDDLARLFRSVICPHYRKGGLPRNLAISYESLELLFRHNSNKEILFAGQFAVFLEKLLASRP